MNRTLSERVLASDAQNPNSVRKVAIHLSGRFWVGDKLVDPAAGLLAGERISPKALSVLLKICESAPYPVSTNELLDEVWKNVFVGDNSLHQVVAQLRSTLDDNARAPKYIETLPRRGYRVVAIISPEASSPPQTHMRSGNLKPAIMSISLVIGTLYALAVISILQL